MNIFISNLNYGVSETELETLFQNYGAVSSAKIIKDRETNRSKGYGFVEMPNDDEARQAIEALNQYEVRERAINVSEAKPREEKPRNSGGYNSNRGGRTW